MSANDQVDVAGALGAVANLEFRALDGAAGVERRSRRRGRDAPVLKRSLFGRHDDVPISCRFLRNGALAKRNPRVSATPRLTRSMPVCLRVNGLQGRSRF